LQEAANAKLTDHAPSQELGAHGPDVDDCVRETIASLAAKPERDTRGRFVDGNASAVTTGERSEALWAALAPAKRELVARVNADRGLNGDAAETLLGLVDGYAEVRLFRQSMFMRLVDLGGAVTNKGKARALYTAYLSALDRETKLAAVIGLERKSRDISRMSLEQYLEHKQQRQPSTQEEPPNGSTA
jgi:hypothetical protein